MPQPDDAIIRKTRLLPLVSLKDHPRNYRSHPADQLAHLVASIEAHGLYRNIVVARDLTILAGHGIAAAARIAGLKSVPCAVLELDPDEPRALKVLAGDNGVQHLAEDDDRALADMLRQIQETDPTGLLGTGYDQAMLATLAGLVDALDAPDPLADADPQTDRAEELCARWGVVSGQVWALGDHRLLCADSTDPASVATVCGAQRPPTVVFDPPYDADPAVLALRWSCDDVLVFTDHRHTLECVSGWPAFRSLFAWDGLSSWYTPGWPLARGKFCLWFGGSAYDEDGAHYGEPGTAHTASNDRGSYAYTPDPRGKHLSTVFPSPATQQFDGHAHAKPTDWVRLLIANCTRGAVLDPFAGSGTTLVACTQLGRTCYAIERDSGSVAVILQRMADLGITPTLLARANGIE